MFLRRRKDVDDATADGHLPATLDEVDPLVTQLDEPVDSIGENCSATLPQAHRLGLRDGTHHRLECGSDRCHDDVDGLEEFVVLVRMG
jgi:hypothetical protein